MSAFGLGQGLAITNGPTPTSPRKGERALLPNKKAECRHLEITRNFDPDESIFDGMHPEVVEPL